MPRTEAPLTRRTPAAAPGPAAPRRLSTDRHREQSAHSTPSNAISLLHYLLVATALVLFALWAINPIPCADLWWQMKTGQLIWNARALPSTDPFSFMTSGRPWIIQEWASEVGFYLLYTRLSPVSLVAFKMLMFAVAMGFGLAAAWTRCRRPLVALAAALFVGYAAHFFADMRPQMVSYACLAALLLLLERDRAVPGSRARWLIAPLMLVWVNFHAAFMAGVSVLLATLAGAWFEAWLSGRETALDGVEGAGSPSDRRASGARWLPFGVRRLLLPTGLALLATFVNPYGPALYMYPFTLLHHQSMLNFVQEWFSPDFHADFLRGYELCLFLLPAAMLASRRAKRPADALLLLFWAHQSLQSRRHIPVFLILALPVLADHLAGAWEQLIVWRRDRAFAREAAASRSRALIRGGRIGNPALNRVGCVLFALFIGLGIAREATILPRSGLFEHSAGLYFFPRAACDFIERKGWSGRMYNEFGWGGYCIWRFYPRQQVFIDGRCEVYFDGAWENHQAIHYAQADWEDRLRIAQIDTLLVHPDSYLRRVLPASHDWQQVYADKSALVYRRKQPFTP